MAKEKNFIEKRNGIPVRKLGSTGEKVTILGVGGAHIGNPEEKTGIKIIRRAVEEGINFLDNAWCYHDGSSEKVMGKAIQELKRDRIFLMTKNHGRDKETFRQQLEESLRRLQTDYLDLLQFHEIIHQGEPETLKREGALEAALKAKDEGKIRYIGFTGHRWPFLMEIMLNFDFPWDTVQMPLNLFDYHYRSFTKNLLPRVIDKGIGVIGMKSMIGGKILNFDITPKQSLTYSLSLPISTLVSGMDSLEVLENNLKIVRNWSPMDKKRQEELLDLVSPYATDGEIEHYKE
ncbi:MAG: aldo/keto reductase [Bacillota bacterium]